MDVRDLLDYDLLVHHQIQGLVSKQDHPVLPLRIYNYTQKAQFEPCWGDGVIDYCRGLIVDRDTHQIIARPFKKFHNLNTAAIPESMENNLPLVEPTITKKMDGSLGIYYAYDGFEGIATRGSFTSDQAQWATAWYNQRKAVLKTGIGHIVDSYSFKAEQNSENQMPTSMIWPEAYTPLFEIIYQANRIVINYDFEGLVLLAMVNKELGREVPWTMLRNAAAANNFRVVEQIKDARIAELKEANVENEEGYVLSFPRTGDPLKVKVKMADYVRLHRIITGMNPRSVWEMMKAGTFHIDNFKDCPASFRTWLLNWAAKLTHLFLSIQEDTEKIYINRPLYEGGDQRKYRAECAAHFKRELRPDLQGVFFAMLDGKDVRPYIWDMIEPRGDDKTFRVEGE